MGQGRRLRGLFRLMLLFAVLATVALLSAVTTIRVAIHGRQEKMPKLVGVSIESARRMTSYRGLELKVEDRLFSTQYPAEVVLEQVPPAGTPLKTGQHVHVLVSLGPPQVTVPSVVGDSLRAAQLTAVQQGLTLGDIALIPWTGAPDQVVAQDPPAKTSNLRTPTLNLLVAAGQPQPAYLCPRFIGQPLASVRRILENNGFRLGNVTAVGTNGSVPGIVLTQNPPPGGKIAPDAVFSFQVTQ